MLRDAQRIAAFEEGERLQARTELGHADRQLDDQLTAEDAAAVLAAVELRPPPRPAGYRADRSRERIARMRERVAVHNAAAEARMEEGKRLVTAE